MYRILRAAGQSGERRAQATHPARTKPELVADAANQVWSWDITKLRGPLKGVWYHLYTVIDIYSRYVVGHLVAAAEDGQLAEALIADAAARERVDADQLTVHADRGAAMTCKTGPPDTSVGVSDCRVLDLVSRVRMKSWVVGCRRGGVFSVGQPLTRPVVLGSGQGVA
jgi:hypothetical protein